MQFWIQWWTLALLFNLWEWCFLNRNISVQPFHDMRIMLGRPECMRLKFLLLKMERLLIHTPVYSVCNKGNFWNRVLVGRYKEENRYATLISIPPSFPWPECMIKRGRFNTWYDICIKVCIIKDSCLNCVFILHILRVESLIGRKEQIIILFELLM